MTTYVAQCFGNTYTVSANWAHAASPVLFDGSPTQYQVADFRHSSADAMRCLLEREVASPGLNPDDDEAICSAIADMTSQLEHQISERDFDAEWEWQSLHIGVDGDAIFTWSDADDQLTESSFEAVIDTIKAAETCNDIARHVLKRNYSSQFCDLSHVSYWLDAADQKWALPCYIKKCGYSAVLWSDTDEAGIDDIFTIELADDAERQVIEFANHLAESLGERVDEE